MTNPRRPLVAFLFALPVLLITAACGSSNSTPTNPSTNPSTVSSCSGGTARGSMSAQINGTGWAAVCISSASVANNIFSIGATDNNTNATNAQIIAMATPAAPGTYQIGPPPGITNGANGLLTIGAQLWAANPIQGNGAITITTVTATGASGTFAFNLVAEPPATGTKTITNGVFNVTF